MKNSTYLSLGLLSAVVIWMLSGAIAGVTKTELPEEISQTVLERMNVRVLDVMAQEISREIVIQGELEPLRQVEIRAQTTSLVTGLPVARGERIAGGILLIQLAQEDRAAQLKHARAEVKRRRFEVEGAQKLNKTGLVADNQLKAVEAELAAAEANQKKASLELGYTEIKAPFGGVLEARDVELGSHVEAGERVALVVDESVLKAVGRVSQQKAGELKMGQTIRVRFLDGREAEGKVTYIARVGDSETRSFRVEAEVPNPDGLLNAGVSAELRIAIGRESAHFLSPAVLSLNETGDVGVKSVTDEGVVQFYPVELVRTDAEGVWVSGLPEQVQVITQGQGFVSTGELVIPLPAS